MRLGFGLFVASFATATLLAASVGCKRSDRGAPGPDTVPPRATLMDVPPSGPVREDSTEAPSEVREALGATNPGFPRASAFDDDTARDNNALPAAAPRNVGEGERESAGVAAPTAPGAQASPVGEDAQVADIPLPDSGVLLDAGPVPVTTAEAEPNDMESPPPAATLEDVRSEVKKALDVRLHPAQSTDPDEVAVSEQLSLAIAEDTEISDAARQGVTVTTLNGVVTLSGQVPSSRERDMVASLVEDLVGNDFAIANLISVNANVNVGR